MKELLDWLLGLEKELTDYNPWLVEDDEDYEKDEDDYIALGYYEAYEEIIAKIQDTLRKQEVQDMDAVRFIKERNRMCSKQITCNANPCPMKNKMVNIMFCEHEEIGSIVCKRFIFKHPEEAVQVVEQWAKDNPPEIDWAKVPVGTHVKVKNFGNTNWNPAIYDFGLYLPNAVHKFVVLDDDRENATNLLWYDFCKFADDVDPEPYYED